jgi:hypothetical protein
MAAMSRRRPAGTVVSSVKPQDSLPAWPEVEVLAPTLTIPAACLCTWAVVRPGPGLACISRLKAVSRLCGCKHEPAAVSR